MWCALIQGGMASWHCPICSKPGRGTVFVLSAYLFKTALMHGKRAIRVYVHAENAHGPEGIRPHALRCANCNPSGSASPRPAEIPSRMRVSTASRSTYAIVRRSSARAAHAEEHPDHPGLLRMTKIIAPEKPLPESAFTDRAAFVARCEERARAALTNRWWGLWRVLDNTMQPMVTDVMYDLPVAAQPAMAVNRTLETVQEDLSAIFHALHPNRRWTRAQIDECITDHTKGAKDDDADMAPIISKVMGCLRSAPSGKRSREERDTAPP